MRFVEIYNSCKKNIYLKYKEQFNYLFFGFVTTIVTLITYYLLTKICLDPTKALELQIANILSWIVGVSFAYVTNRKYVFESSAKNKKDEFIKFTLSRLLTLILDITIMFVFVTLLKYNDRLIKLISQIVVIVSNYVLSKMFVFSKKELNLVTLANKLFVLAFLTFLTLGFTTIFRTPKRISYVENRFMSHFTFPTFNTFKNKEFQDTIETAMTDQFFYSQTIKVIGMKLFNFVDYSNINSRICEDKYVYVADGYVTYDCNMQILEEPRNKYNEEYVPEHLKIFNNINNYVDTYYYVLDWSYAYDFKENKLLLDSYKFLKDHLTGNYKISRLEVNSYEDYLKYFYKTDHHWNYLGYYQGYKDIVKLLELDEKPLVPTKKDTLNKKFYGSYAKHSKTFNINDEIVYYDFDIATHTEYLAGKKGVYGNYNNQEKLYNYANYYASVFGGDYSEIVFDFNDEEKDNLLIIGTSFTNPINRLVASHYNKTYVLDGRYYELNDGSPVKLKDYIDDHHIDKVLILASTEMLDSAAFKMEWGD